MRAALRLYGAALRGPEPLLLRDAEARGAVVALAIDRWRRPARGADRRLLQRVRGPVLDVGCGPGRHLRALVERGVASVGIDLSPTAVALARRSGAPVHHGSVFGPLPRPGDGYATALLLDGNIGIGGDATALLTRAAALVAPDGRVLCETDPPGGEVRRRTVRLERAGEASEWFPWCRVPADALAPLAARAGLSLVEDWQDEGRWFAELRRPAEEAACVA